MIPHCRRFFEDTTSDTQVAGLYDLGPTIGKGHYAVVKLARHVFTGEQVAVKVIDKTKLDAVSREHLFQEVVCMKLVQHPNVVRLYEVIDTVYKLYLVLELGDGGDLYDYIMRYENGLSEKLAKRYFRQIVTAIAYCHNLHVVHRDLKPENVVFFEQLGVVKLTDFGFSNQFVPGKQLDTFCGSLAYSAPEILLGTSYDAPKVDIWSLGVILFMLVCGHLPFEEANDSETLTKIMDCEYKLPADLSPSCCSLISRLLIRDPSKRAQLDEVLQDEWLQVYDEELPIELFSVPLISQEHLSFEDHMEILNKMASGGLATLDEIQTTLDRNEYSHISATYYLLAERKLKRNYIEEYKYLSAQADAIEQVLPLHRDIQPTIISSLQPSSTVPPKSISASLAASGAEERLRRFSMILEDEEEEEEDRSCGTSTIPPNILAAIESSDEAMLNEEEEEIQVVVSLACVRSEMMEQEPTHFPGLYPETDFMRHISTRQNSRIDLSDRAESEFSLGEIGCRKSAASLTASRHHRRLPLRPLVSVKSSPQLLKYIAEECPTFSSKSQSDNETEEKNATLDITLRPKKVQGGLLPPKKSNKGRAKSPPWSQKVHSASLANFSAVVSRPISGINWPLPNERIRGISISSCHFPNNAFLCLRHTPSSSFLRSSSASNTAALNHDRRRSGPPGFSVLGTPASQGFNNNNLTYVNLLRASLNLVSSRSSSETSEREPECFLSQNRPTLETVSALDETKPTNQPVFRVITTSCQSAPSLLDNLFIHPNDATVPSMREVCAPIREEEEMTMHSPNGQPDNSSKNINEYNHLASTSLLPRNVLADSNKKSMRLSHLRSPPKQSSLSPSQHTASNFSLSSLASSLRDSRHMMDIIRGTYELHLQSKRRSALLRMHTLEPKHTSIGDFSRSSSRSANASLRSSRRSRFHPPKELSASPRTRKSPTLLIGGPMSMIGNHQDSSDADTSKDSIPLTKIHPGDNINNSNTNYGYQPHHQPHSVHSLPNAKSDSSESKQLLIDKPPDPKRKLQRFPTFPSCKLKPVRVTRRNSSNRTSPSNSVRIVSVRTGARNKFSCCHIS